MKEILLALSLLSATQPSLPEASPENLSAIIKWANSIAPIKKSGDPGEARFEGKLPNSQITCEFSLLNFQPTSEKGAGPRHSISFMLTENSDHGFIAAVVLDLIKVDGKWQIFNRQDLKAHTKVADLQDQKLRVRKQIKQRAKPSHIDDELIMTLDPASGLPVSVTAFSYGPKEGSEPKDGSRCNLVFPSEEAAQKSF